MVALAFIGCGGHSVHHAKHHGSMGTPYAAWDPDAEALKKMPVPKRFDSLEALLADEDVDAVVIASPDQFHLEQIGQSLEAGKHVFCEKPLLVPGQAIEDLVALFDLADEKKLKLTTCHLRRFDRPFEWMGRKLRSGEFNERFGEVVSFDFDFSYHTPSNAWKHGRSLLLDHLNHEVDLMNAFFGIQGFNAWKLIDGHDIYDVSGRRDDDITFHFKGTRRLRKANYLEGCRIRFEGGGLELKMMMGLAQISDHDKKIVETFSGLSIDYEGRLAKVMDDFTDIQIGRGQAGYLSRVEMLMNTEAGIQLAANDDIQRIDVRS